MNIVSIIVCLYSHTAKYKGTGATELLPQISEYMYFIISSLFPEFIVDNRVDTCNLPLK